MRARNSLCIQFLAIWALPITMASTDTVAVEGADWPLRVVVDEVVPGVQKAWLEDQAGRPFLWVGDTCWFLTFKATPDEVIRYLDDRASKGIRVVQCMLIPWTREGDDHWFGDKPFHEQRLDQPNERYCIWNGTEISRFRRSCRECVPSCWAKAPMRMSAAHRCIVSGA